MENKKMVNKTELQDQYKKFLEYLMFYEYMLECAEEEVEKQTGVVSDRVERLVIDKPIDFIKKHFLLDHLLGDGSHCYPDCNDYKEMLYNLLRQNYFRVFIWTDDDRGKAGNNTIHIMKANHMTKKLSRSAVLKDFLKLFKENRRIKEDIKRLNLMKVANSSNE